MTTRTGAASCVLVFSDVDETLISRKSMVDFLDFYLARQYGDAGVRRAERIRRLLGSMAAAGVPREQANRAYYRMWAGERADEVAEAGRRWWAERGVEPGFYLAATRAELERHRASGAILALVSGAFPAVVRPIAADVGAAYALCTLPQVHGEWLTGDIEGAPMIGEAKRLAVRELLRSHPRAAAEDCFAYGDHESDLAMLSEVGNPVVVGEDPRLLRKLPRARVLPAA